MGWRGTWPGRSFAGVNLIEAEPSDLAPIALDEHYRRVVVDRRGSRRRASASTSAPAATSTPMPGRRPCSPGWSRGRARLGGLLADDLARPARAGPVAGLGAASRRLPRHADDGDHRPLRRPRCVGRRHGTDAARRGARPGPGAADPAGRPSPRPVRRGHRAEPGRAGAEARSTRSERRPPLRHPSTIAAMPTATTAEPTRRCRGRASSRTSQPNNAPTTMLLSRAAATRATGASCIARSTRM